MLGFLSDGYRTNMKKVKADLLQGTLELLVLRLLRSGRFNGWDIMQRLQLVSGEVLSVTPGALYPALHRLEERGLISAVWGPSDNNRRAKFYELTAAGRKQLDAERKSWERFSAAVALILRDA
jgi:transcriptional regulator